MLKQSALRRIAVTTIALVIFGILSFFPVKLEPEFANDYTLSSMSKGAIYLIDPYEYVARSEVVMKNTDLLSQAREIIETLTIQGKKSHYLPNGFQAVLPIQTTLLSIDLQDSVLKLNFDEKFLKIPKDYEEKAIECLIYSLTELPNVKGILLYVNGELLTTLPNSKIKLPALLTRDYGINKIYDLTKMQNAIKTTTYYISKYQNYSYYVPVTEIRNDEKEKVEIIIERLKSSPINQTNLMSYLNANAELLDYELLENELSLSFNRYLLDDFEHEQILEEVAYSIALSLRDTMDVSVVHFLINDNEIKKMFV